MQAMTQEQNEQWQRAVMRAYPVPDTEGRIVTLEKWITHRRAEAAMLALLPKAERTAFLEGRVKTSRKSLEEGSLPDWVLTIRDHSFNYGHGYEFGFRYDVGLLGLQVLYGTLEYHASPYHRLLLGFLRRSLRPLVESEDASKDAELRQDFEGFYQICCLCESDGPFQGPQPWLDIQHNYGYDRIALSPRTRSPLLTDALVKLVLRILYKIDEPSALRSMHSQLFYLYAEYREFGIPENDIALAFLEALEAECPPPDWLPKL